MTQDDDVPQDYGNLTDTEALLLVEHSGLEYAAQHSDNENGSKRIVT